MLLTGNHARGTILFQLGELGSATQHLEKALAVFDIRQLLPAELEPRRIGSFFLLSSGLHELGYPDRARAISHEMLEVAQRSSVPSIFLAQASVYAAFHNLAGGNHTAAQKYAEEAMALSEEKGLVTLSALATSCHGAALIAHGRYEEGIAGLRRGISALRATGGGSYGWPLAYLAIGLAGIGRPEEGLQVLEEGFA